MAVESKVMRDKPAGKDSEASQVVQAPVPFPYISPNGYLCLEEHSLRASKLWNTLKDMSPRAQAIFLMYEPSIQENLEKIVRSLMVGVGYYSSKVIAFLKNHPKIVNLEIEGCEIPFEEIYDLAQSLQNNTLRLESLKLLNCKFPVIALRTLAEALKTNRHLKHLSVNNVELSSYSRQIGVHFSEVLKVNSTLQVLEFENCSLDHQAVLPILRALADNPTLRRVNFNRNRATFEEVVKVLADLRVSENFERLDLRDIPQRMLFKNDLSLMLWNKCENFLVRNPSISVLDLRDSGTVGDWWFEKRMKTLEYLNYFRNMIREIRENRYQGSLEAEPIFGWDFHKDKYPAEWGLQFDALFLEYLDSLRFSNQITRIALPSTFPLRSEHIKKLTQVLEENQVVTKLSIDLEKQTIDTDRLVLAAFKRKLSLESFMVTCSESDPNHKILPQLNDFFKSTATLGMKELFFGEYCLGQDMGSCISRTLMNKNSNLEFLELEKSAIGIYGGSEIIRVLNNNNSLKRLHLSDRDFDSKTSVELATVLSTNKSLMHVKFVGVFDKSVCEAFTEMMKLNNTTMLECATLEGRDPTSEEFMKLQWAHNEKVERRLGYHRALAGNTFDNAHLWVENWSQGDKALILEMCADLRNNRFIRKVYFMKKHLNMEVIRVLCESLKHNQTVTEVLVDCGDGPVYILNPEEEILILEMLKINTTLETLYGFKAKERKVAAESAAREAGGVTKPEELTYDPIKAALAENYPDAKRKRSLLFYKAYREGLSREKLQPGAVLFSLHPCKMVLSFAGLLEGVQEQEPDDPNFPSAVP